jgi:hypothetical protein
MLVSSSGQYTPNVDTRLFWEDIPFGLCILKNLAEMLGTQIFFSTVKCELQMVVLILHKHWLKFVTHKCAAQTALCDALGIVVVRVVPQCCAQCY